MEHISVRLVERMINADVISENESDEYRYRIQVILEKIVSYSLILGLALALRKLPETLLFIVSLSLIRKYSGGIHCEKYTNCLIISTAVSISGCYLFPAICHFYSLYQGIVIMSVIIILLIGSINNSNIDWDDYEYVRVRRISRMALVFEGLLMIFLQLLNVNTEICFLISYGIVVCAISMLLEIRKRGGKSYEEN